VRASAPQKFNTFNIFNAFNTFAIIDKFANFANFDAALACSTPPHVPPRGVPDPRRIPSLQSPTGRVPMNWMEEWGRELFN
jgi:hypothetical protein